MFSWFLVVYFIVIGKIDAGLIPPVVVVLNTGMQPGNTREILCRKTIFHYMLYFLNNIFKKGGCNRGCKDTGILAWVIGEQRIKNCFYSIPIEIQMMN